MVQMLSWELEIQCKQNSPYLPGTYILGGREEAGETDDNLVIIQ